MANREEMRKAMYAWLIAEDAYTDEMNRHVNISWGTDTGDQTFEKVTSEAFIALTGRRAAADGAFAAYRALLNP